MSDFSTTYLGLKLKNPLIASSSGLTNSLKSIKELEESGVGAVVLKSLFEEQISYEAGQTLGNSDYPEAADYVMNYAKDNSVNTYIKFIEEVKANVSIPVIASINCYTNGDWIKFAKQIEEAGADALEINIYVVPTDLNKTSADYEKIYTGLAERLKETVNIPIAFKLGYQFTSPVSLANQLYFRKIEGVVLFNRFYSPDIDVDKMEIGASHIFSSPADIRHTLRWTSIVSSSLHNMDVSASTGVHDGRALIKLLLAGASTVQVCSVLYKNGIEFAKTLLAELDMWMKEKGFNTIDEFRGKLNYEHIKDPSIYERSQFMKYFSKYE